MSKLSDLAMGDVIMGKRTMRVKSVGKALVYLQDVQSGQLFCLRTDGTGHGAWRYEMVTRVPRKPKPYVRDVKEGDVLTGAQVKARPWKRGTHLLGLAYGHHFLLTQEGDWYSPAKNANEHEEWVPFEELPDFGTYRVLHVG